MGVVLVPPSVGAMREYSVAHSALERSLARVDALVGFQVVPVDPFAADTTLRG